MPWQEILGHDAIVERFRAAIAAGRLASTFLFVGPSGIGKRTFARKLAQVFLCEQNPAEALDPCTKCDACRQAEAATHPDLLLAGRPPDKAFIPLETFLGDDEHRLREGLCHAIYLKPFRGGKRIAIIDDADYLNEEGANCLLKTLEEPPPHSLMILIGTSEQRQLPTIRSRSQIVRFAPLAPEEVAAILSARGLVDDADRARRLASVSHGRIDRAMQMGDEELADFREQLLRYLADPRTAANEFAKKTGEFIDAAGKEAPIRRARFLQLLDYAAEFYGELMRRLAGAPAPSVGSRSYVASDAVLLQAVELAASRWKEPSLAADCLERCIEGRWQVEANANQGTLLESWYDDLIQRTRGQPVRVA